MALMTSDDELCVGIHAIDSDHRILDEALAAARSEVENGRCRERLGALLRTLEERTLSHFALEEGMMAAMRYPGLARHRLNHQRVMDQMRAIVRGFRQQEPVERRVAMSLLADLLAADLQRDDMHFGRWLSVLGQG